MKRRTALAALAGAAAWRPGAVRSDDRGPRVPALATGTGYAAAMREGEAALARGDANGASSAFDRAARMQHAADSEVGLVRAAMQRGEYAQALAFCAHTAGSHPDTPAAAAVYAWLLRVGGQPRIAADVLARASSEAPGDPVLGAAREALAADWPVAGGALLDRPCRTAPEAWPLGDGAMPPRDARVVSSGVVVDGGDGILVPLAVAATVRRGRTWVRNGLGATVAVDLEERQVDGRLLLRLRPRERLPAPPDGMAARDPFAGSPGFAIAYATQTDAAPAWPLLWQGFLGGPADDGLRRLGIDVPAGGTGGGAVLDAAGRVAGPMLGDGATRTFVPGSSWRVDTSAAHDETPTTVRRLVTLDQAYERALRLAVQVIVADSFG